MKQQRPTNRHDAYHAHVYFDEKTLAFAKDLCDKVEEKFSLKVGKLYQKPIGPHPCWSCQILFTHEDFDRLIPWLDEHRGGLSILVHASTGHALLDHTTYAYWLGDAVELNLDGFE